MRALVIAFALGAAAFGVVAAVACLAAGAAADAAESDSFRLAAGPLVLVDFARTARGTETTLGLGVLVVAFAGGVANAAAAAVILRRRR